MATLRVTTYEPMEVEASQTLEQIPAHPYYHSREDSGETVYIVTCNDEDVAAVENAIIALEDIGEVASWRWLNV